MRIKTSMLLVVVALLATACFKSDTRIRVNDDGSGEIESLIALEIDAALDLTSAFATEDVPEVGPDEACDDFEQQQDVPEGATVRPYEEDGFCGLSYTLAFGADEFQSAIATADAGGEFELRRDGSGWYFESVLTEEGLGGDDLGADFLPEGVLGDAEVTIGVLLPGRQVEHNASYIDTDGTLVWEINLTGGTERIFARTEAGETILGSGSSDGGGSAVAVILVILLLVIIGAAVWLIIRRRRQRDEVSVAASTFPPTQPGPVPSDTTMGRPVSSLPPPPTQG